MRSDGAAYSTRVSNLSHFSSGDFEFITKDVEDMQEHIKGDLRGPDPRFNLSDSSLGDAELSPQQILPPLGF